MRKNKILSFITAALFTLIPVSDNYLNIKALDSEVKTAYLGDVNGDNCINSSDASAVLQIYSAFSTGQQYEISDEQLISADVNSDGAVDSLDASKILEYYAYVSVGGNGTIQEFLSGNLPPSTLPENSTFSIMFIDVGQADAALIKCDNHYMMIDGGNVDDSSLIYSILKDKNINHLDIVVGTHAHEDHIGGLAGALNYATADMILCPATEYNSDAFVNFKKYSEENGNGITVPSVNDTYTIGSADIKILGVNSGTDINDTSIVLRIEYGETSFLFTGDATRETEQVILNSGADLESTVLKVGHHGSDTSTSYVWLNEIMPKYAVISAGNGNSYGHPTDAVLSRLSDADVITYRTDLNGNIKAVSDGSKVTFTTDRIASNEEIFTPATTTALVTTTTAINPVTTTTTTAATKKTTTTMATTTAIKTTAAPITVTTSATSIPPNTYGTTYVLNVNTKKFHYSDCSSAKKIKAENRGSYTGSRDELIGMGYSPCGNCKP